MTNSNLAIDMKTKTVLAIGDSSPDGILASASFDKFVGHKKTFSKRSIDLKVVDYYALLGDNLPRIDTEAITVMLFFPYSYWNENIEVYTYDDRIYGDETFGKKFNELFNTVDSKLQRAYKGKKLSFVNPPQSIQIDRDKKKTKSLFKRQAIPTPPLHKIETEEDIIDLLEKGHRLYAKPRFGAMGKGITYLTKGRWRTNYLYKRGKIVSRNFDYGWGFVDVTGKLDFLKELIKRDMVFEQAIDLPTIEGRKFDMRIYVIYGKVPYLYARTVSVEKIVTNWSQGGRIEKGSFLRKIPKEKLNMAKSYAIKGAQAIGINYAGMDLIFSGDFCQVYVLEGHSFPSYERRFGLTKYLIEYL